MAAIKANEPSLESVPEAMIRAVLSALPHKANFDHQEN